MMTASKHSKVAYFEDLHVVKLGKPVEKGCMPITLSKLAFLPSQVAVITANSPCKKLIFSGMVSDISFSRSA